VPVAGGVEGVAVLEPGGIGPGEDDAGAGDGERGRVDVGAGHADGFAGPVAEVRVARRGGEEAARPEARVVDGLARAGVHEPDEEVEERARGVELAPDGASRSPGDLIEDGFEERGDGAAGRGELLLEAAREVVDELEGAGEQAMVEPSDGLLDYVQDGAVPGAPKGADEVLQHGDVRVVLDDPRAEVPRMRVERLREAGGGAALEGGFEPVRPLPEVDVVDEDGDGDGRGHVLVRVPRAAGEVGEPPRHPLVAFGGDGDAPGPLLEERAGVVVGVEEPGVAGWGHGGAGPAPPGGGGVRRRGRWPRPRGGWCSPPR